MAASLSHDVILDVLCRLGVKDLLRFRCVSKPFCSSIDDPDFIKNHLSHSLKTNTNSSLIFRCIKPDDKFPPFSKYCYFLSVDFDSLKSAQQLNHPFEDGKCTEILCSCNGLLALFDGGDELVLWNPSTRKSQILPLPEIEFPSGSFRTTAYAYGLGYDSTSDDYKLVRAVQVDSLDSEVKVYSLKTNSWRRIKDFPFNLTMSLITSGFQANNALHWVVSKNPTIEFQTSVKSFYFIAAFDLETEEFRPIELPSLGNYSHFHIKTMGGFLCLIVINWPHLVIDIWIMKEYGVKESWTKLLSLNQSESMLDLQNGRPLAFSKNGDKVLLNINEKKLFWYDLTSKRVEQIRIEGVPSRFCVEMLVESLVPLNGNAAMINKEKKQASEKRQKEERKKNSKRDDFLSEGFHLVL